MQQGEVWVVSLPFSGGREQSGERPALILQDAAYGQSSPLVLIALLTSQLAATRFPATVRIDPNPDNGLSLPSVAMVFQARALDRSRFLRQIGKVAPEQMTALLAELNQLTGQTTK